MAKQARKQTEVIVLSGAEDQIGRLNYIARGCRQSIAAQKGNAYSGNPRRHASIVCIDVIGLQIIENLLKSKCIRREDAYREAERYLVDFFIPEHFNDAWEAISHACQ